MMYTGKANRIIQRVAEYFDVSVEEMKSKSRSMQLVQARKVAMYLIRHLTSHTLCMIGSFFNRTHATVITSIEYVDDVRSNPIIDQSISDAVEELIDEL